MRGRAFSEVLTELGYVLWELIDTRLASQEATNAEIFKRLSQLERPPSVRDLKTVVKDVESIRKSNQDILKKYARLLGSTHKGEYV